MRTLRLSSLVLIACVIGTNDVTAQGASTTDSMAPSPLIAWRDLAVLGSAVVLATVVHQGDLSMRGEVRSGAWQSSRTLDALTVAGNAWGQPGVIGLGLALWGGGRLAGDRSTATVGLRAVEAIGASGAVTAALKGLVGRARPRVSPGDAWDVEFGRGFRHAAGDYSSMPSGHTTAAFAFATAVTGELVRRKSPRARLIGATTFALAGVTAYARMHSDAHWLSDVAMGAVIGVVGGRVVTRWHATRPGNSVDAVLLGPGLQPLVSGAPGGRTLVGATIRWP